MRVPSSFTDNAGLRTPGEWLGSSHSPYTPPWPKTEPYSISVLEKDFLAGGHILAREEKLAIRAGHFGRDRGLVGVSSIGEYRQQEETAQSNERDSLDPTF